MRLRNDCTISHAPRTPESPASARSRERTDGRLEEPRLNSYAALRKLVLLEQHNVGLCKQLLALLVKRQAWQEAAKVAEAAFYIALDDPKVHEVYALVLSKLGDNAKAEFERESAKVANAGDEAKGKQGDADDGE